MEKIHKTSPDDSAMPNQEHDGLTKREYFAVRIMQALLTNPNHGLVTENAVKLSDSLIEALNK